MNEEQNKKQLPRGWKWEKVSSVAELFRGINYTKDVASDSPFKDSLPILRGNNINGELNFDDLVYVPKTLIKKEQFVKKDDIIFAMSSGSKHLVGKSAVSKNDFNGSYGAFCALLRVNDDVNKKYISYIFKGNSYRKLISEIAKGTNINNLKREHILDFKLPLPPKPIQHAIVSKIEELFSELDKGIENLRIAQQQLKTFRQSVLKWAFEGRLTNEKVKEGELPKGWKWMKSGDFFDFVTSGSRGWAKYYSDKGAIFIRITNLDFDSMELDLKEGKIQYVNPPLSSEGIRTKVQEGDFLFSITGYLGMLAIAPKLDNAYVNQHVSLCRPKNNFNKKYLGYWIVSKSGGHHYLNKNQKGAVKAGLNLDDLKAFPVPICTIEEQNRVVQIIESRLSVTAKMEESIHKSMEQAEALKQSILKGAFEGKLM